MRGYSERGGAADRVLDALSHPLRRRLLFELYERAGDVRETAVRVESVDWPEAARVEVQLHHVHLPKLGDAGYVRWDDGERTVVPGPNWEEIEPLLAVLYRHLNDLPPGLRGTRGTA